MITLSQVIDSQQSLHKLSNMRLPIGVAYKISKLINKLQPDLRIYEEQRAKLVKDLGEQTDKEKDLWTIKPENTAKFTEEIKKLQEIEVNLNFGEGKGLEKVKVDELGDVEVEPNDLVSLDWLFE